MLCGDETELLDCFQLVLKCFIRLILQQFAVGAIYMNYDTSRFLSACITFNMYSSYGLCHSLTRLSSFVFLYKTKALSLTLKTPENINRKSLTENFAAMIF